MERSAFSSLTLIIGGQYLHDPIITRLVLTAGIIVGLIAIYKGLRKYVGLY